MKIVQIITRLIVGGAQANVLLTCRGLIDRGHDVTLLTGPETGPEGDMFETAQEYGVGVRIVDSMRRNIHPHKDIHAFVDLTKLLRAIRPDIVHTHSSKAGILGRFAGRSSGYPAVVHTIHGLPFFPAQNQLLNWTYILAERLAATQADKIITVAEAMTDQAVAARLAPKDKFITINAGFNTQEFLRQPPLAATVRERLGIPAEAFVVGKLARLAPNKGHEFLLEALGQLMARHEKLYCLLVGDGTLRSAIEATVEGMGVAERFRLVGLVEPSVVPQMLSAMDMLVHTSLHEGLPLAVVEALIAGLPVAAFDLDGAREVIQPGKTGYLLKPRCVEHLSRAIEATITGTGPVSAPDEGIRASLAERFSWQNMVGKLETLYASLLETKHHRCIRESGKPSSARQPLSDRRVHR